LEAHASVESLGDDVDEAALGDDVEVHVRVALEERRYGLSQEKAPAGDVRVDAN
jgi:hypothetical protein